MLKVFAFLLNIVGILKNCWRNKKWIRCPLKTHSGWFLNLASYLFPIKVAFVRSSIVDHFEQLINLLSAPQLFVLKKGQD